MQVAQGDLAAALKSYSDGLAIAQRLAQSHPGNAGWQRELSLTYSKLASACLRSNDIDHALPALREGKAIMDRLVTLSPDNAVWKRELAWFDRRMADLAKESASTSNGKGN